MKTVLSLCSIFSTVAVVHALPPIEARTVLPNPGEDCVYHWPGHNREYSGKVTRTHDCKGGVSFWQYGKDADVQCCVREPCTGFSDTDGGKYGQYSCLNTYKTDECGGGSGKFVAGHCLGDSTVQCCHDQLTYTASTTYNSPEGYVNGEQDGQQTYQYDPATNGIIVPTIEGSGPSSSSTTESESDRNGVVVPSYPSEERQSTNPPLTDGLQSDGTFVVPTVEEPPQNLKDSLSWKIIPKVSA